MSGSIQEIKSEIEAIRAKFSQTRQNVQRQIGVFAGIQAEAEKEIKQLEAQGAAADPHYLMIYSVRRAMAIRSRELLTMILSFDPDQPNAENLYRSAQGKMQMLNTEVRYLSAYFSLLNYRPIVSLMEQVVASGGTGELPGTGKLGNTGRLGSGPLKGRTGPLGQNPGSGPLGRARTGPLGSGPLNNRGTGPLKAPGAKPAGPLGQRTPTTAAGAPAGTGPLTPRQQLQSDLSRAVKATPTHSGVLTTAIAQFKEAEAAIEALAGPEIGTLSMPHPAAQESLNKIQGKIYYLKRTLAPLVNQFPGLAFDIEVSDVDLQMYMAKETSLGGDAGDGGLTSKLKSLFGGLS